MAGVILATLMSGLIAIGDYKDDPPLSEFRYVPYHGAVGVLRHVSSGRGTRTICIEDLLNRGLDSTQDFPRIFLDPRKGHFKSSNSLQPWHLFSLQ
ncbi:hypothetical protein EYC84_003301 [Monilinia fructicola]|uniref:Uncharacterized protein n=1 Tax=Monilinia fructicola TaxID=38448 RepID=A0A5M9JU27_MONFR|nr:hypothetical protein EYC84_003301 [Monilinia fructicola]